MSKKEVENSKLRFVPAKKAEPKRERTTYIDEVKVSRENHSVEKQKKQTVELHYKDYGKLTEDEAGSFAMRKDYSGGASEFYIKQATAGPGTGRILNPWGVYFQPGDETKFEKDKGRKRYEFKRVGEDIFNLYLKFLTSGNERYLLNAERSLLDAS